MGFCGSSMLSVFTHKQFHALKESDPVTSVIRYGCVTVAMVDIDRPVTVIVKLKHFSIAMVPPPGAQLPVPATGQSVEELWVLHTDHSEEVLVSEVPPELVLNGQLGHVVGL